MKKKEPMLIITIDPSKRNSGIESEYCTAYLVDATGEIELAMKEFPFGHQDANQMVCSFILLEDEVKATETDPVMLKRKLDLIDHFC